MDSMGVLRQVDDRHGAGDAEAYGLAVQVKEGFVFLVPVGEELMRGELMPEFAVGVDDEDGAGIGGEKYPAIIQGEFLSAYLHGSFQAGFVTLGFVFDDGHGIFLAACVTACPIFPPDPE